MIFLDTDYTAHDFSLEPANVMEIAAKVAELRGISVEIVGKATTSTLKSLLAI